MEIKSFQNKIGFRSIECVLIALLIVACQSYHKPDRRENRMPSIFPDYCGVTLPFNIAPANFMVTEQGEGFQAEIGIEGMSPVIIIASSDNKIRIPQKEWKSLLSHASGKSIYFRISVKNNGEWILYNDIVNSVSSDSIDEYLVYRLLYPGYELWNEMGIYQRNLTTFEQMPVLENKDFDNQCVNCHTFNHNSPKSFMIHVRGPQGGTLVCHEGSVEKVQPKPMELKNGATYPSWHPSGKYITFSSNNIQQFFHRSGKKTIEVSDLDSDLITYKVDEYQTFTDSIIFSDDYMETFPTWAPDGKTLYFCRSSQHYGKVPIDSIYYDLYRVKFDETKEKFDSLECVYNASASKKSVSFPRVSPDGKYVMFTQSDYGNFSIWHPESDLYLLNLSNGEIGKIPNVNSVEVESFHTWSSTGKWFVFSSKRMDGLWARPFFAHFNSLTGKAEKPFVLPQENPSFYNDFMMTYNLPELIVEKINVGIDLLKAIHTDPKQAEIK